MVAQVEAVANEHHVSMAEVALAWVLRKPSVASPIIGATKLHHLDQAIAALSLKLSSDDVQRLETPYVPHPVLGFR